MIRDPHTGREWGTPAQLAARLGPDVTADRIRDWARRSRNPEDPLHGLLPGKHVPGRGRGTTWYRYDHAAHVEALTRKTVEEQGGPARGPRGELTPAA
ncbi:hypothetical protein [Micromonospora aurantiaca (nom. illeg.)]|uniref:hypothetical protein n=1 Tax=Micromonospora aurantiaca (nom. illeg.) TaxID=47850 RepID=UPI0033D130A6